jgi:hypothetical protein
MKIINHDLSVSAKLLKNIRYSERRALLRDMVTLTRSPKRD